MRTLARLRVPLGFLCAAVAFALVQPSAASWTVGFVIAAAGEAVRLWAAGHIEKGREITRSGPYRFVRHPLYLGSLLLGVGFAVATRSATVALLCALYLGVTIAAAIRTEEATLDARFDGQYSAYRAGTADPVHRRFSWRRVKANREYRAVLGLAAAFLWLWIAIEG
jgi:protein-S-isoprenylcysteine O-methyltransferase Ste14